MINYNDWYRANGIRNTSEFTSPELHPMQELTFPLNSSLHYSSAMGIGDDEDTRLLLGPSPEDPLISKYPTSTFLIEPLTTYVNRDVAGRPVVKLTTVTTEVSKYINSSSRFLRLSQNGPMASTTTNFLLYTYTAFDGIYRYQNTLRSGWNAWYNHYGSMLMTLSESVRHYPLREQFLIIEPPVTLPSLSALNDLRDVIDRSKDSHYLDKISDKYVKMLRTDAERTFVDLWLYFGNGRRHSLFGQLDDKTISKINIVWFVGGKWLCANVGRLNAMVNRPGSKNGTYSEDAMAKNFLAFMFRMVGSISQANNLAAEDDTSLDPVDRITKQDKPVHVLEVDGNKVGDNQVKVGVKTNARSRPKLSDKDALALLQSQLTAIDKEKGDGKATDEDSAEIVQAAIDRDIEQLESISAQRQIEDSYEDRYTPYKPPSDELEYNVYAAVDALATRGALSPKEVARIKGAAGRFKEMKDPYGSGDTIAKQLKIDPEVLKVEPSNLITKKEIKGVRDKSMMSSSITSMEKRYIKEVMHKDVLNAVMHLQRAGYAVNDYKIDKVVDLLNKYDVHTVQVVTPKGATKNVQFTLPKLNKDGSFFVGGVKYRMRPQNADCPIRKVSPMKVAMTAYAGKIFIERTSRTAFNYSLWVVGEIRSVILDSDNPVITDVNYGNVFVQDVKFPRAYSAMAGEFIGFKYRGYQVSFDYAKVTSTFPKEIIDIAKKHRMLPFGTGPKDTLFINMESEVFKYDAVNGLIRQGSFEAFFGLNEAKRPTDYAEFKVLGDDIPLGIAMAYRIGLGNLLATLKSTPRRIVRGGNYELSADEYIVKFQDEALIFDRRDRVTALLMNGFNRYKNDISKMSVYHFDNQEIYGTLLMSNGIHSSKLIDVDTMFDLWIDAITAGLLKENNLPTDMFNLLLVAVDMLTTDYHQDPIDTLYQRCRGNERMAGAIYSELYKAVRSHRGKSTVMAGGLDVNPQAVWYNILNDSATMGVEESNPIHYLKEQEEMILGGTGGRSTRTLTAADRRFHKNAMGVISEATVDSGEVAAKIFRSADPNYDSLRGTARKLDKIQGNIPKLVSTSALLAPQCQYDDPKRINFINIQNSSTTFAKGYTAMPLRTGYDSVLAHRTNLNDIWSTIAEQDGEVESIKNNIITVKYADGSKETSMLGIRHGKWSGKIVPHEVVTALKVGDKVKVGDFIAYNKNFYSPDPLYPDELIYKGAVLATFVLWEADDTYEDSCAITPELAAKLETRFTKDRVIRVAFDYEIRNLVKVNDKVESDDLLCTLFPPLSTSSERYDEVAQNVLGKLSNESPKAHVTGVVEAVDMMYSGDTESMTASLRAMAESYDSALYRRCKQLGEQPYDASVEPNVRVDGNEIGNDSVAITVRISEDVGMGTGDKLVLGNQMKSVAGRVISGVMRTKSGLPIDMTFGAQSPENRVVRSLYHQGTTNRLLVRTGQLMVAAFFGTAE